MRHSSLCRELSRKVCNDLGATPYSIRQAGLTHPDLILKDTIKISEDGVTKTIPMWYGEALGSSGLMCCLLVAIDDDPDNLEIACIIGFKNSSGELQQDAVIVGFRYDWANDSDEGMMIGKISDKKFAMSLAQRLTLALGMENMVQDGVQWKAGGIPPPEFRKILSEIIEVDN